jgi:hypothetical protein
MFSFKVDSWKSFENQEYEKGVFLWIIHADKIPPHIGISKDGFYFSLKVSGKDEQVLIKSLVVLVDLKKISTLAIQIIDNELGIDDLITGFGNYIFAESNVSTCLTPISKIYFPNEDDFILSELLEAFQDKALLGNIYGLNLKADFKGIPFYKRSEITNRLIDLENVKRR